MGCFSDNQNLADIKSMSIKKIVIKKSYRLVSILLDLSKLVELDHLNNYFGYSQNVNADFKMSLVYSNVY